MKAGVDIVLFVVTVYDYFFGKKKATNTDVYEPDHPFHADIENDSSAFTRDDSNDGFKRYRSASEAHGSY